MHDFKKMREISFFGLIGCRIYPTLTFSSPQWSVSLGQHAAHIPAMMSSQDLFLRAKTHRTSSEIGGLLHDELQRPAGGKRRFGANLSSRLF